MQHAGVRAGFLELHQLHATTEVCIGRKRHRECRVALLTYLKAPPMRASPFRTHGCWMNPFGTIRSKFCRSLSNSFSHLFCKSTRRSCSSGGSGRLQCRHHSMHSPWENGPLADASTSMGAMKPENRTCRTTRLASDGFVGDPELKRPGI